MDPIACREVIPESVPGNGTESLSKLSSEAVHEEFSGNPFQSPGSKRLPRIPFETDSVRKENLRKDPVDLPKASAGIVVPLQGLPFTSQTPVPDILLDLLVSPYRHLV